jgi:hypothetical protein
MRISDTISPPLATGTLHLPASPLRPTASPPQYVLDISEAAQQKIDQLQQGNQALQQAITQSRQADKSAALERVSAAKEYLKILARLSPAGDRGAASEAARIAREIRSAASEFKAGSANGEGAGVRSEIGGFAEVAGDALKIARSLVENYLRHRSTKQKGDNELENEIRTAVSTMREMVSSTLSDAIKKD